MAVGVEVGLRVDHVSEGDKPTIRDESLRVAPRSPLL